MTWYMEEGGNVRIKVEEGGDESNNQWDTVRVNSETSLRVSDKVGTVGKEDGLYEKEVDEITE